MPEEQLMLEAVTAFAETVLLTDALVLVSCAAVTVPLVALMFVLEFTVPTVKVFP